MTSIIFRGDYPRNACYRCLFPTPPPPNLIDNCSFSGVIGAVAGIAGSMAASIAIQMIIKPKLDFFHELLKINCIDFTIKKLRFTQKKDCIACSQKLITWPAISYSIDLEHININEYLLIDLRENSEDRSHKLNAYVQNVPFSEFIKKPQQLPKMKILLFCSRGARSEYAAHILRELEYEAFSLINFN